MVHVGGLRQAGRARRIDVERAIFDGEHGTVGSGELVAGKVVEIAIDAREVGIGLAVKPDLGVAGNMRARTRQRLVQLVGHDDVLGIHHIDAVGERHSREVGVDECNDAAGPRDADPGGQEFRSARHHQTDDVALVQILRQRPARIAVGARCELAVGEAFPV